MKKTLLFMAIFCLAFINAQTPTTDGPDWTVTNITSDNALDFPWEITYAPDDNLWITERVGEKIVNYNITTSSITTMIDLNAKIANSTQGGLMGMAIHPDLYADINTVTNNYVFASYTYDDAGTLKTRIVRLLYNNTTGLLTEDTSVGNINGAIIEGMPGSVDHNSGRLIFGPDSRLYYTIGDQGSNQFSNACNPIVSQNLPISTTDYNNYPGKTLRIEIDGGIPTDNPTLDGVKSHVYTYGHRNPQGIVFTQDGALYSSEHGPKTDDELNKIISGQNYGWPEIAGYYDNRGYTYRNESTTSSCTGTPTNEEATEYESYTLAGGAPANFQNPIGTYNSTVDEEPTGGYFGWPGVAPSSIDIHETGNIPCWDRSLLVPTLKRGTIFRAKLTPDGNDIVDDYYEEFHSSNDRYRDIAISPDGLTIYAVTDNSGGTSGPSSTGSVSIMNPGVIIKLQYVGPLATDPVTSATLEDVVSYCPITIDAAEVMSNNCVAIVGTTSDPLTYSSGTNVVEWTFDDNGSVFIANQTVVVNTLEVPSNIMVVPSSTSAVVSWDPLDNTTFDVRYREVGATPWLMETVTINSITLTGLTLSTDYEFQALTDCGGTQSAYSAVTNFTTLAITYCDATVDFTADDFYIKNVELLDSSNAQLINNTSTQNDDIDGYTDYTDSGVTIPNLSPQSVFNINITLENTHAWNKTTGHSVWIDYNQDGFFTGANELVWGTTAGDDLFPHNTVAQGSFIIPENTPFGLTRMRIGSRTYYTPEDSCNMDFDNNNGGEYEDYTININETLSVNTLSLEAFNISPNPFNSQIKINKPSAIEDLTVTLFDIQGRIIKKEAISGNQSGAITINNLEDINTGVYFIRISDGKSVSSAKKLVKI